MIILRGQKYTSCLPLPRPEIRNLLTFSSNKHIIFPVRLLSNYKINEYFSCDMSENVIKFGSHVRLSLVRANITAPSKDSFTTETAADYTMQKVYISKIDIIRVLCLTQGPTRYVTDRAGNSRKSGRIHSLLWFL